jgi:hypothetical protein
MFGLEGKMAPMTQIPRAVNSNAPMANQGDKNEKEKKTIKRLRKAQE